MSTVRTAIWVPSPGVPSAVRRGITIVSEDTAGQQLMFIHCGHWNRDDIANIYIKQGVGNWNEVGTVNDTQGNCNFYSTPGIYYDKLSHQIVIYGGNGSLCTYNTTTNTSQSFATNITHSGEKFIGRINNTYYLIGSVPSTDADSSRLVSSICSFQNIPGTITYRHIPGISSHDDMIRAAAADEKRRIIICFSTNRIRIYNTTSRLWSISSVTIRAGAYKAYMSRCNNYVILVRKPREGIVYKLDIFQVVNAHKLLLRREDYTSPVRGTISMGFVKAGPATRQQTQIVTTGFVRDTWANDPGLASTTHTPFYLSPILSLYATPEYVHIIGEQNVHGNFRRHVMGELDNLLM